MGFVHLGIDELDALPFQLHLATARRARGMTRARVAVRTGLGRSYAAIETGQHLVTHEQAETLQQLVAPDTSVEKLFCVRPEGFLELARARDVAISAAVTCLPVACEHGAPVGAVSRLRDGVEAALAVVWTGWRGAGPEELISGLDDVLHLKHRPSSDDLMKKAGLTGWQRGQLRSAHGVLIGAAALLRLSAQAQTAADRAGSPATATEALSAYLHHWHCTVRARAMANPSTADVARREAILAEPALAGLAAEER